MFTLPDLPYSYGALEPYIDEETMKLHHDKHHQAYVDNLNKVLEGYEKFAGMDILDLVQNLDKVSEEIRTKVRNNAGGHANHSMFWKIMREKGGKESKGDLMDAIKSTFGNFEGFKEKFSNAALGRFGSGWVWLVLDHGKLSILDTPNQDTPLMEGKKAILVLDVWEHAYYIRYRWQRGEYIKNWWNVVNWDKVSEYFQKLK